MFEMIDWTPQHGETTDENEFLDLSLLLDKPGEKEKTSKCEE